MSKNVLIIGGGGREHALVWKLAQSPRIDALYVAPGNGGTRQIAQNIPIVATDVSALVRFAHNSAIDLTVVGPDDSLALGIVDAFKANGMAIFGPTQAAAVVESSKAVAKDMMNRANISTAHARVFWQYEKANLYIQNQIVPMVVKASGLALGKGVYVCHTVREAHDALRKIMIKRVHGEAGDCVIVEEFLKGPEVSAHAFCDGSTFVLLPFAQDHKPVYDNDRGLNTGGMGTITPVPWLAKEMMQQVGSQIVGPMLGKLVQCKRRFTGLLYPGLKITDEGLKVLEFNVRFGDPETQSYMRLLKTDLLDILEACVYGTLADTTIEWHKGFAACVVMASGGYPSAYEKGFTIEGLQEAQKIPGVVVFHAGTVFDGAFKTSGGRVLGVSAIGDTLKDAIDLAYKGAGLIRFKKAHYRKDIGRKTLAMMP